LITWTTARPDWEQRIIARESLLPDGLPIDRHRAAKALRIFKRLKVSDIPGKPTLGECCPEWIFDLVWVVFGCFDSELKRQLIRQIFVLISKKNGKSTIAAGIMMTALIMNERAMGEFLILAPTKDVADNSFDPAYGMVMEDSALLARFKPSNVMREIVNRLDGSKLIVKSADADVVGGTKATAVFIDELWLFGKKLQAANILSEATGSQASRPEGFVIYATTQSDEQPAGVFKQKLKYFRAVRDGKIDDPTSLPLIYEYPEAMVKAKAYQDRTTWYIPNPSLGKSVDEQWLITTFAQKQQEGPGEASLFIAKHFNVESGLGLKSDDWVGANHWEAAADVALTLEELLDRSEVVTAGIDGGGLDDLLGLAILGRERDTRRWLLWIHAWAHPTVLERRTDIATKLKDYEENGDLTLIEEVGEDIEALCQILDRVNDTGLFPEKDGIGVDPAGITEIVDALELRGFSAGGEGGEDANIVAIRQGWTLTMTIKTVERKLAGKKFVHGGTPLMNWCVSNAKVVPAGNAITITKQAAGSAKIDPLMATFDAAACMAKNPVAGGRFIYNERDAIILA